MYWFTKIKHQDTERTFVITLTKAEAECCRMILINNGYSPDEIRIINFMTLEEGVNTSGERQKILSSAL